MNRYVWFVAVVNSMAAISIRAQDYPVQKIKSGDMTLTVLLPGVNSGYYRGSRFDWGAIVSKVEYAGHTVFQEWKSPHNPTGHDDVGGTAEEFGMLLPPLGYAEAKPGGKFLKIGIGLLTKPDDKAYQFYRDYVVSEPAPWTVETRDNRMVFRQTASTSDGFGYQYVKRIRLPMPGSPVFVIERELTNTGKKNIHTDHYGHNFISFDKKPIGPDYRLSFHVEPKPRDKKHDLAAGAKLEGKVLSFEKELSKGTIYTELLGFDESAAGHEVTVIDVKTGFGINITGDKPVKEWHVWAIKTALCPEPFVEINLKPAETFKWSTKYELIGPSKR